MSAYAMHAPSSGPVDMVSELSHLHAALKKVEQAFDAVLQPSGSQQTPPHYYPPQQQYPSGMPQQGGQGYQHQGVPQQYSQQPSEIIRADFFKDVVGMDENTFRDDKHFGWSNAGLRNADYNGQLTKYDGKDTRFDDQSKYDQIKADFMAKYPRRAAIFQGKFEAKTVGQLEYDLQNAHKINQYARFNILFDDPLYPALTDIRYLQSTPRHAGYTFQLASTFFGPLEGGMVAFNENLEHMLRSPVQGEEASIGTAGATIYRKYFMPTLRLQQGDQFGYEYLLSKVRKQDGSLKLKTERGGHGLRVSDESAFNYWPQQMGQDDQTFHRDLNNVMVGIHQNIAVTSGYGFLHGKKHPKDTYFNKFDKQQQIPFVLDQQGNLRSGQLVNHILTAAYNLGGLAAREEKRQLNNPTAPQRPLDPPTTLFQMILQASYKGTVLAAALLAQNNPAAANLYLTLVGAGSFRNDIWLIGEAIVSTMDAIKRYGLNVSLIYRSDPRRLSKPAEPAKGLPDGLTREKMFLESMIAWSSDVNNTKLFMGSLFDWKKLVDGIWKETGYQINTLASYYYNGYDIPSQFTLRDLINWYFNTAARYHAIAPFILNVIVNGRTYLEEFTTASSELKDFAVPRDGGSAYSGMSSSSNNDGWAGESSGSSGTGEWQGEQRGGRRGGRGGRRTRGS